MTRTPGGKKRGMRELQEMQFDAEVDYRALSPHLKHRELHNVMLAHLRETVAWAVANGLAPTVLEIGAGDGGFVEPALAYGYDVTATELSSPAVERLDERYGGNSGFEALLLAEDGSLGALGERRFSVVLYASVLHHIPDYLQAIDEALMHHLTPAGALITFQDPLWYPGVPRSTRWFSELAFLTWRLSQGYYRRGIESRLRHWRGLYDDDRPGDVVEYHVVRDGVDQRAIANALRPRFDDVRAVEYWSTAARLWQDVGRTLGMKNTFGMIALGYRP